MADIHPEMRRLLRDRFAWEEEQSEDGGLRASGPLPNLGALTNHLPPERRMDYFRFWVCEILDETLLARFCEEAVYPDRLPPSLRFVKAALERHKGNPRSRAYLFCLNLLVIYALDWRPDRPTQPMLPLMAGEGAADQPWAQEAREYLIEKVLAGKIAQVAREAYARHARGRLRHIELQDVEQEAKRCASRLIAGECLDEMARALVEDRADEASEDARPLQVQLLRQLGDEFHRQKVSARPTWKPGAERYEEFRLARNLIIGYMLGGYMLEIQDALTSGTEPKLKSFWPHGRANLVTHLFGPSGKRGRLYQELRDWLKREAKRGPVIDHLSEPDKVAAPPEQVKGADQQVLDVLQEDSELGGVQGTTASIGERTARRIRLDAETFHQIDWEAVLNRAATPLNLAIMEGGWVEGLDGRQLRRYLYERGFADLPSSGALRQRKRYLLSKLKSYYSRKLSLNLPPEGTSM